jgi:hypothetical protein
VRQVSDRWMREEVDMKIEVRKVESVKATANDQ